MRALRAAIVPVMLAGCAFKAGPDYVQPELDVPDTFGPAAATLGTSGQGAGAWWRGFADPALDALIDRALGRNLDIHAAAARLAEARALLRAAEAGMLPQLGGQLDAGVRERLDDGADGNGDDDGDGSSAAASRIGSAARGEGGSGAASLIFSWSPDLFGGRSRAIESAQAEARRRDAVVRDLRRTTAAEVARGYVALRLAAAQLALLDSALELQNRTLDIVRIRREAGLAAQLDVERAISDLAATQAQRGPLQLALESARHALAVLAGEPPRGLALQPAASVPDFGGGFAAGTPRDLLRRRPDLAAAEANLARATADIGVATSALYPSLSLPGSLSATVSGLGSGDVVRGIVASVSAVLDVPLFDAGGRRAEVDAAQARAQEALAAYRSTLLNALQQAETALVAIGSSRDSASQWSTAVAASERAFAQADALYREGLSGFLDVLEAQRTLLANRESLLRAQADLARSHVDFHAAVGG